MGEIYSDRIETIQFVASELKDPICHSDECQIGSFSSEATNLKMEVCQSRAMSLGCKLHVTPVIER